MPAEEYEIISGIVVASMVFLIIGFFVVILVVYMNQRKKKLLDEKQTMELNFQRALVQSQQEIQEQAFNHISQEIHDNVGQVLSLAKVQINIMNESDNLNKEVLNEVKENVSKAMTDLRDIAKSLNTDRIRSMTIQSSVRIEAERISKTGFCIVEMHISGEEKDISNQKKLILFRIIQESLQNCIKHANASSIKISFNYLPGQLCVSITDNGKGFEASAMQEKGSGLGLMNIQSRTSLAGGTSNIESKLNGGTTIKINMPYE